MPKLAAKKWRWLTELHESWHEFTSLVLEEETGISDRRTHPICASSGLKGLVNGPSLFPACEGKLYANLWALICAVAGHTVAWFFIFLQAPSPLHHLLPRLFRCRASGNSHLFVDPPNYPVDHEMSSFYHSEMQMTGAIIISHPVIISYAFWKGRKCVVLSLIQYCLLLERTMTSNTNAWKGLAAKTHIVLSSSSLILQGISFCYYWLLATLCMFHSFPLFWAVPYDEFHISLWFYLHKTSMTFLSDSPSP